MSVKRREGASAAEDDVKKRVKVEGESNNEDQSELYTGVLEGMRRQETAVVDTRLNFTFGLPKKARIPKDREQWRSLQNLHGKLTNHYAPIDMQTVKIEGPLTVVDFQPLRADGNNFRFLKKEELVPKLTLLNLLGSPESFNNNQTHSNKSGGEGCIVWVKDKNDRLYPMTEATWAHLYRSRKIAPVQIHSDSGWQLRCDQDRIFVVPQDFIPPPPDKPTTDQPTGDTNPTASDMNLPAEHVTPAVALSKAAPKILS